jgi:hydrogenase maturation protease
VRPRILVAGVGNIFLGDDGFGPAVVRRLAAVRPEVPGVRITDYGIRGMHLAYDLLDGYDALIIVDALPSGEAATSADPGSLVLLEIGPEHLGRGQFDAHGMNPMAVLASLEQLGGTLPPTYLVGCIPESLPDSLDLSGPVAAAVDDAVALTSRLVDDLLTGAEHRLRGDTGRQGGGAPCVSESPAG